MTIKINIDCKEEACYKCGFGARGYCEVFKTRLDGINGLPPFVPCKRLPECLAAEVTND